jgi:hypothetical protein
MTNELLVAGVPLDLEGAEVLPTFQVSDLVDSTKVMSDYSPELSLPPTARNHHLLGQAAYDSSTSRTPYRTLPDVLLRADGVEIMPRAKLLLKGFDGRYQVQLVSGNKRLVEALGEKTLRDLNLTRFAHTWTLDNVAQYGTLAHYQANGWSYEVFELGKVFDAAAVPFTDCYPTLSARLLFDQMLADAGFTADNWQSPLLDRLAVPVVAPGTFGEDFREARHLFVGIGPGHEDGSGAPAANRNTVTKLIPFDDTTRRIGTRTPILPAVPLVYDPTDFSWNAQEAVYVSATARCNVDLTVSYNKASAQVYLLRNGQELVGGEKLLATRAGVNGVNWLAPEASGYGLLLQPGDKLQAKVVLRGEEPGLIGTRWGYRLFADTIYVIDGETVPLPKFEVTVDEALPPGAMVRLQDWLPEIKLLDFFKCLLQLGGLTVATDAYENRLHFYPSGSVLDNAAVAHDWTGKRDQPPGPAGTPRAVSYRLGSFAQRNDFRWKEDETVAPGTGNGALLVDDTTLPLQADLLTLPFAASQASPLVTGLLRIARFRRQDSEDPLADPIYEAVTPQPRLVLRRATTLTVTLRGGPHPGEPPENPSPGEQIKYDAALARYNQLREVAVPTSYFDLDGEPVSLDAARYVLPVNWRGLRAALADVRVYTERFRLSPVDVATFNPSIPVYVQHMGYCAVQRIAEYTPRRPVEVQLVRLHPSFLAPPAPGQQQGQEFYEGEWFVGPNGSGEFY